MAKKKKEMDKLAWENAQALAAGMSYGKWKAMQVPVKPIPKLEEVKKPKLCRHCGKELIGKQKYYCDAYCGMYYRYKVKVGTMKEGAAV